MAVLYDLTPLTGRLASDNRRTVVLSRDISWDALRAAILSVIPAIGCTVLLAPFLGVWGLIIGTLVGGMIGVLTYVRSPNGMQLRLWRQVWNRRRAMNGHVLLRGKIVNPEPPRVLLLSPSLVEAPNAPKGNHTGTDHSLTGVTHPL